jgi:hypothetical protein
MEPNFIDGVVAKIRAKNREDYEQVVFSAITDLRIWVQENAEKAALAFLAVGFLIPFLFQFLLLMLGLAALVGFVIWTVALPANGVSSSNLEQGGGRSQESDSLGAEVQISQGSSSYDAGLNASGGQDSASQGSGNN